MGLGFYFEKLLQVWFLNSYMFGLYFYEHKVTSCFYIVCCAMGIGFFLEESVLCSSETS